MCVCDHVVFVGGRKKSEGGHECSMYRLCIYTGAVFFHVLLKFKMGMPVTTSTTTPLCAYMLRIHSAVILVPAINSLKMKQMIVFFCFAVVERLHAELISKYH